MPLGRDRTRENGLTVSSVTPGQPLPLTTGTVPNATGEVPAAHRGFIASISLAGATGNANITAILTDHVGGWNTVFAQVSTESGGLGDELVVASVIDGPAGPGVLALSVGAIVDVAWIAPSSILNHIGGLIGVEVNTLGSIYQRKEYVGNILVECLAGGGAGGGGTAAGAGAGGGAGGYARRLIASANLAGILTTTTVGSGGSAGASGAAGNGGGASIFNDATFGVAACGGAGGATGAFAGGLGGCGGTALCGDFLVDGGDGDGSANQPVVVSAAVTIITGIGGRGGASFWGGGAPGPVRSATNAPLIVGNTGAKSFGAGGGGGPIGISGSDGSPGKQGVIVIWEFI